MSPRLALAAALVACTFASTAAFADAPRVTKGPWLVGVSAERASIRLELSAPSPIAITLRGPDGSPWVVESSTATTLHDVAVGSLAPSTAYVYEAHVGNAAPVGGRFVTAPLDARPFSFVAYGDNRSDAVAHAAIARLIEATPTDFLVNTGDMTARGDRDEDWASFFGIEAKLLASRPIFAVVGNHELYGATRTGDVAFLRYFGSRDAIAAGHLYETARWGNTRFFLLNAMDDWTGAERDWLRGELERADHEAGLVHRVVVMHHGPYSSGPHAGNRALHAAGVVDAMRAHGVDLVLAGHDHLYERGDASGLKYVVTGGAGAPTYPSEHPHPAALRTEVARHFVEVRVDGDTIATTTHLVDGSILEACTIAKGRPWSCSSPAVVASAPPPPVAPAPAKGARCSCEVPGRRAGGARAGLVTFACLLVPLALRARARRR